MCFGDEYWSKGMKFWFNTVLHIVLCGVVFDFTGLRCRATGLMLCCIGVCCVNVLLIFRFIVVLVLQSYTKLLFLTCVLNLGIQHTL